MAEYAVDFETALSELDVARWFEDNITHETEDFVLRYVRDGYYCTQVDGIVDCDLIRDNPDFSVCSVRASEEHASL